MTKTKSFLSQELTPKDELLILAGAGISKSSPSNLPTGIDFINAFFDFLIEKDNDLEFNKNVDSLKTHNSLRFENIMSRINKDYPGKIQALLECYRECKFFNQNHILLKDIGKLGHIISTTNFDSLIERAYIKDNLSINPIIYDEEFNNKHQHGNIYKLHGSISQYNQNDKKWVDCSDSIQITLEQIGKQGYEFSLNLSKRKFLIENILKKHLIVVGYSGYDDFDIIPILRNTKSDKKVIWLEYTPDSDKIINGRDITKSPDGFGRIGLILCELINNGLREIENCSIVMTNSTHFLESIINITNRSYQIQSIDQDEYKINTRTYFSEKLDSIFPGLNHIIKIKATLYFRIENFNSCLRNYDKILEHIEEETNLKLKSSMFHEMASCYANLDTPDYENAIKFSLKSYEIDIDNKFPGIILSADQLANLLIQKGNIKEGLDFYESIMTTKIDLNSDYLKYQFAVVLNNFAINLLHFGKVDEAIKKAEQAAILFKKIGDINGLVNSTITIASPLMELGKIDQAIKRLKETIKTTKDYGLPSDECTLYNELGIAYRLKEDLDESIKYHQEALQIAESQALNIEVARNLYNIALCHFQKRDFELSKEYNYKSMEIREYFIESKDKYTDLSENMQLFGTILLGQAQLDDNPTNSINKLKNARKALEKSNEFAKSAQYLKAICDNYSNLLTIALLRSEDSEVDQLYNILKNLLTSKINIPGRLENIEFTVKMYREARRSFRNIL